MHFGEDWFSLENLLAETDLILFPPPGSTFVCWLVLLTKYSKKELTFMRTQDFFSGRIMQNHAGIITFMGKFMGEPK